MGSKKEEGGKVISKVKKIEPYFKMAILFSDGKKISKIRCSLDEVFDTYFISIDKYLNKGYDAEQLLDLYQKTFKEKGIKVVIHFIDSWEHLWKGKYAWPKREWFINYLNKKLKND